jgi:hypothetical protein
MNDGRTSGARLILAAGAGVAIYGLLEPLANWLTVHVL